MGVLLNMLCEDHYTLWLAWQSGGELDRDAKLVGSSARLGGSPRV